VTAASLKALSTPDDDAINVVRAAVLDVPVDADLRAYGPDHVNVVFVEMVDADGRTGTGFTYTFGPGCAPVKSMVDDVIAPIVRGTRVS
jgi:L-alanine-DL-glutamate epimerase-like enolase superfamily enzyme